MRQTGSYPLRRVLAFILALLLIVNIISGSAMTAKAEATLDIIQTFEFVNGLGEHETDASKVKIKIQKGTTTIAEGNAGSLKVEFQGEAGEYNYSISTDAYGLPITGSFQVMTPPEGTTVTDTQKIIRTFDDVEGQFTEVTVSGTITDGVSGVSDLAVTGYYGAEGSEQAFQATTSDGGEYSAAVKINTQITIVVEHSLGKYEKTSKLLNIGTKDIDGSITVAVTKKAVTIEKIDPNIIDASTIEVNESTLTTPVMVNYGEDCQITFTEKDDMAGRYTSTYTVNGKNAKEVDVKEKKVSVTIDNITEDTKVEFQYETKGIISDITTENEESYADTDWADKSVTIKGKVVGISDSYKIHLISIDGNTTADTISSGDIQGDEFEFTREGEIGKAVEEQFYLQIEDTITQLKKTVDLNGTPINVKVDKAAPVLGETVTEGENWVVEQEGGIATKLWAKNKAIYSVQATDDGSGIKAGSFQLNESSENERMEQEAGKATVKVDAKEGEVTDVTDTITVEDMVGNQSEQKQINYTVDNENPAVDKSDLSEISELYAVGEEYYWKDGEAFNILLDANDEKAGSGISKYSYIIKKDGEEVKKVSDQLWQPDENSILIEQVDGFENLAAGTTFQIYLQVEDRLGNKSEETCIAEYKVDNTAPEITFEFQESKVSKLLSQVLSWVGIVYNETMEVTVTADDRDGVGFAAMDRADVFAKLNYNGNEIAPAEVSVNNNTATAVYKIVIDKEQTEAFSNEGMWAPFNVSAADALDNNTGAISPNGDNCEGEAFEKYKDKVINLLLDTDNPQISAPQINVAPAYIEQNQIDSMKKWYGQNASVEYAFHISDAQDMKQSAGIYNIETSAGTLNGVDAGDGILGIECSEATNIDSLGQSRDVVVTLTRANIQNKATGECTFTLKVTDNAGNTEEYTDTVFFDVDAPEVNGFKFSPSDVEGKQEAVGTDISAAVKTDYGYFFNQSATVTVNVTDYIKSSEDKMIVGSGVKGVEYKLIPTADSEVISNQEWTPITNISGNDYSFYIAEKFKGNICVRAIDNVEQTTQGYDTDGISPEKVVLESQDRHDRVTSASVTLNDTQYKDAAGNRLYPGTIYSNVEAKNTFAGIKKVQYTRTDERQVAYGSLFQADIENGGGAAGDFTFSNTENNLVTGLGMQDVINFGQDVEVSNIAIDFNTMCNSNHTNSVAQQIVSYDTWAPRLVITWDNNDVRNEKYYNASRTATIQVTERNFDESQCEFLTTGPSPAISGWSHNGDVHTATVTFSADGDYTFTFRTTDRAGHTTVYDRTDEFTIDMTAPVIAVSYDNNSAQNGYYYKDSRTAGITITEHNFRASDVAVTMTASDNGSGIAVPAVNGWSSGGDLNTASIHYGYDGEFTFAMTYVDLAGNQAVPYGEDHFIVDLTDPELEIYDIEDKSANNDVVAPGVRYSDTNVNADGVTIKLDGANTGEHSMEGSKTVTANGVDLKLEDFPREKETDDLYTMTAHVEDLSGRFVEQTLIFSVNRFGSVYVLDDSTKDLVEENDGYTNKEQKVGVHEINVDLLEAKDVSVSRDGDLEKLKADKDYTVKASGDEASWKEYYYQLDKENFEEEGAYNITIFSTDRANNTQDNKNNKRNEECTIEFVIDKTAPSTVISGIENVGRYRETEKQVHVDAKDNILLDKVITEIDGEIVEYDSAKIAENGGTIDFTVGSADKWQKVRVYSVDKAGNTDEQESESMRVIVTSNLWVQFVNNTPLLIGIILLLAGIAIGCVWFFVFAKRDKEESE